MIRYERLDIEKILRKYNVRNISRRGDEIQFSCPFPEHIHGDRNPSSAINSTTGQYHCFSCGRKGSLVNFIADMEAVPLSRANRWLEETAGEEINKEGSLRKLVDALMKKDEPDERRDKWIIPDNYIGNFAVDWFKASEAFKEGRLPRGLSLPFKRGFTPKTLLTFQIGFDSLTERLSIPVRDSLGRLVGFKGRATNPNEMPRYKSLGDKKGSNYGFPTCKVHKYVFGLYASGPDIIIVEGEFDVMWLWQNGIKNAVALGGSNPSKEQIAQIREMAESVTLMLDPDEAGTKAERQLVKNLVGYVPVRIAFLEGSDPADTKPEDLHRILSQTQYALTNKIDHIIKKEF